MADLARKLVLVVTLGACLLAGAWHTQRVFDLTRRDYGEGVMLEFVERWRTEPVTAHWASQAPFTLSCYGPTYYWLTKVVSPWTPWDHTLIPGRLVALVALFATSILLVLVVRRRVGSWEIGALAALFYLVCPVVGWWLPYHRVDTLAVFLALTSYAVLEFRPRALVLSAVLIVLGSTVKQTVALAALPVALALWCDGQRRSALTYSLAVALLGAATWGGLAWASEGYWLRSAIQSNLNRMVWRSALVEGQKFVNTPVVLLALAALATLAVTDPRRLLASRWALALPCSALFATLFIAKEGATINYYLEASALAALVVAIHGLGRLWTLHADRTRAVVAGLVLLLSIDTIQQLRHQRRHPPGTPPDLAGKLGDERVLADGQCIDLVLAAGAAPVVNDSYLYRLLLENRTLKVNELLEAVRSGALRTAVLTMRIEEHLTLPDRNPANGLMWPRPILDEVRDRFELIESLPGCHIYRRRNASADPAPIAPSLTTSQTASVDRPIPRP